LKKAIITIGAVALAGSILLVSPIRSLAVSALSVFRVDNAKTIEISLTDIEELVDFSANFSKTHEKGSSNITEAEMKAFAKLQKANNTEKPQVQTLNNVHEFDAFDVSLPEALETQQADLQMLPSQTKSLTIDTKLMNKMAKEIGLTKTLDEAYDKETLSITTSPTLMAKYENLAFVATQGYQLDSPGELAEDLRDMLLTIPGLPENLRSQLAEIDISGNSIYLPVVMGVGREVNLGSNTGYIYASTDMSNLAGTLSEKFATEASVHGEEIAPEGEMNTIIWVDDNILYALAGSVSEDELANIARSVK
jgi:hypothetical protein